MEIVVLLDQHERHADLLSLLNDLEMAVKRCTLPVGDIWILVRLPGEAKYRLWMVIERKAKGDAIRSLGDQRYREQKARLSTCPSIKPSRIVWLFEMSDREWMRHEVQHLGMQASLLAHGMIPQRTLSVASTVKWLRCLVRKVKEHVLAEEIQAIPPLIDLLLEERDAAQEQDPTKDYASLYRPCIAVLLDLQGADLAISQDEKTVKERQDCKKKRKRYLDHVGPTRLIKAANSEPGGDYLNALAAVRGMSMDKARSIAKEFPSFGDFLREGLDKDRLANIQITGSSNNNKTRRLGPKLAERLILMTTEKVTPSSSSSSS